MSNTAKPLSMIVAMARGRIIGNGNKLPWRLPADLAFFKKTTMGHPVIMGRKTYESIGKPLPGRLNIILTRDPGFAAEGCLVGHSPEEALRLAGDETPFVIGGSEIYALFLPYADRLYVTEIDETFEGDATFPAIDPDCWVVTASVPGTMDDKNRHPHTFVTYERNPGSDARREVRSNPDYKADLVTSYDNHAAERNTMHIEDWKVRERGHFLRMLRGSDAATLLEIGSGPGRDALFFGQEGLDVTCTDQSPEMVKLCHEKGLRAEVRSFDALGFADGSFDAVFGLNCLLHVPKAELASVLQEIRRVLKPGGLFYMGVYGGQDSEGIWEMDKYEPKRFFAMYSDGNLLKAVGAAFKVVYFDTVPLGEDRPHFQSLVLKKG